MPKTPNLFLIGTQKGGSTSLHNALVRHPEIGRLRWKEPNIFSQPTEEAARKALEDFPVPAGDFRYVIDGSIDYSRYPKYSGTPRNILKICGPDVRFVYILRNPVERLVSNYFWMQERYGLPFSFETTIANDPQYVQTGLYDLQIERYLELFDLGQFHFVRHRDFVRDPVGRTAEVFRWLGLDPEKAEGEVPRLAATDKTNTRAGRFGAVNRLLWSAPQLRRTVRTLLPDSLARRAVRLITVEAERKDPSREVKRALLETHFLASIDRTEQLTGLDLTDWKAAYADEGSAGSVQSSRGDVPPGQAVSGNR